MGLRLIAQDQIERMQDEMRRLRRVEAAAREIHEGWIKVPEFDSYDLAEAWKALAAALEQGEKH